MIEVHRNRSPTRIGNIIVIVLAQLTTTITTTTTTTTTTATYTPLLITPRPPHREVHVDTGAAATRGTRDALRTDSDVEGQSV